MSEITEIQSESKRSKLLPILLVGGLLAVGYLFISLARDEQLRTQITSVRDAVTQTQEASPDSGIYTKSQVSSYQFVARVEGQTPFSLLIENAEVEYDQYDFGVFVTSINDQRSTSENYWAVYVNGEYAQEASDKLVLEAGDEVEWRWEEMRAFE